MALQNCIPRAIDAQSHLTLIAPHPSLLLKFIILRLSSLLPMITPY